MTTKKPERTPAQYRAEIRRLNADLNATHGKLSSALASSQAAATQLDTALAELAASKDVETIRQLKRTVHRFTRGKGYTIHD